MGPGDLKYEAGDPVTVAEDFAAQQSIAGYPLEFSLASLETQVDRLLVLPIFRHGGKGLPTDAQESNEAAAIPMSIRRISEIWPHPPRGNEQRGVRHPTQLNTKMTGILLAV